MANCSGRLISLLSFSISVARKLRRRIAGCFGRELNHRGVLQHDRADDGFGDGRADGHRAMVLEQHRPMRTERARDAGAHLLAANEIDRAGIDAKRLVEKRARLAVGAHRPAGCRQGDGIGRMRMQNAVDVDALLEYFGMDVDLAVPARRARDHITVEVDRQDVLGRDLVEADAVRLHEEEVWLVREPERDVAAGKVVLPFADQDFAGPDELLFDLVVGHVGISGAVGGAGAQTGMRMALNSRLH